MATITDSALRSGRYVLGEAAYVEVLVQDRRTYLSFGKDNRVEITKASYRGGEWHIEYTLGSIPSQSTLQKVADSS